MIYSPTTWRPIIASFSPTAIHTSALHEIAHWCIAGARC
ncbi:elongation factor P hydroxylase [Sodalis-like endosymbiont of Proechinophthirus fluctus]